MKGLDIDGAGTRFIAALAARRCVRAFLPWPVPLEPLRRVLTAAAQAPSTRNGQPWRVAVLTGPARDELATRLRGEFDRGVPARPDYRFRSEETDPVAEERAREAGAGVLLGKGIARDDPAGRRRHLRDNLSFHGAPVAMACHLPGTAGSGAFLETGLFLQNVMLGLSAWGLGSCPQFSVAGYPDMWRAVAGLGPDRLIVCGLAVGYPDLGHPVNSFTPARALLAEYTSWHHHAALPTG